MAQLTEQELKKIADIQDRINRGVKIQQRTQEELDRLLAKQIKQQQELNRQFQLGAKAQKIATDLTEKRKQVEKDNERSISSIVQNIAKGNLVQAAGLDKTNSLRKKEKDLAREAESLAKDELVTTLKTGDQRLGIRDLTQEIADGTVKDKEEVENRINSLGIEEGIKSKLLNKSLGLLDSAGQTREETAASAAKMEFFNKAVTRGGVVFAALFAIAQKFAASIDAIGKQFGSLNVLGDGFKNELLSSQEAVVGIGASLEDVVATTNELSSEFGLSLDEAVDLSAQVIDTARAVGLSNEEAAKLSGILQTTSGLSGEQAEKLTEGAFQLAAANRVNPSAVLKDMAASSEAFASFSEDGGDNLAKAAVQARALGLSLDTTAKIAEGLLDFEQSITKEVEASVLIGRQLNFQKARELALNNDIEGAISNVVSQLGSEAEFNKLNSIQRKAIADSIGVSVTDMAKMVANQDKSNMLAGETAKSFADIIGKDAMSELTATMNELKIFGVALANTLGPILMGIAKIVNFVLTPIGQAVSGISRSVRGVDDFHTGPGGITTMMGPAGVFSLNPRDSVLATTNPIPVRRVNDIYTTGAGGLGVGGGNMNVNVTTGGISGRDIPLLAEVEFDGNGTESLSARV
jgi:hypothetical protein